MKCLSGSKDCTLTVQFQSWCFDNYSSGLVASDIEHFCLVQDSFPQNNTVLCSCKGPTAASLCCLRNVTGMSD